MAVIRFNGATPVAGSLVSVFLHNTQAFAAIYADALTPPTPQGNPFLSDPLTGLYSYWAEPAVYDETIGGASPPTPVPSPAAGTTTHTGPLTANQLVVGNGNDDLAVLGTLGTATTVLHGNPAGPPAFGTVVNADLAIMADATVKANLSGAPATPTDATMAELATAMNLLVVPPIVQGDLIYGDGVDSFAVLPKDTVGVKVLTNQGASNAPLWSTAGSGLPVGADGAVQYNNGGAFGGFGHYNDVTGVLELSPFLDTPDTDVLSLLPVGGPSGSGVISFDVGFSAPITTGAYEQIGFGMQDYIATDPLPTYLWKQQGLGSVYGSGIEVLTNETVGVVLGYSRAVGFNIQTVGPEVNSFEVYQYGGLGATAAGMVVGITHNSDGSGAGATLGLNNKSGTRHYLWVDATGALRKGPARPTANGSVSDTSGSVVSGSGLIGVQVITATGAGTYTPTSGTVSVVIELIGGGGGGGGVASPTGTKNSFASGGGGGGYSRTRLTAAFSGAAYVVGAKGAGGSAGNNPGAAGSDTTFTATGGGTVYTAGGGGAGSGGTGFTAPLMGNGIAAGGTVTNGTVTRQGEASFEGMMLAFGQVISGRGGGSPYGSPGAAATINNGTNNSVAGVAATGKGAGGGGAVASGTGSTAAGGNGSDGLIIIWEYS